MAKEVDVKMFGEWHDSMEIILKEKSQRKDDLDHQIHLLQIQTSNIKSENEKSKKEFEQWKKQEMQKFENEKGVVNNELLKKQHDVDFGLTEHTKRMEDLEKRELAVKTLEDSKHQVSLDRIELENLMIHYNRLTQEAESKLAIADDRITRAVELEGKANEEFKRLKSIEETYSRDKEEYEIDIKSLRSEQKNLEELRKTVKPQIEEFKALEAKIAKEREEVDKKLKDLVEKVAEEKSMFETLSVEKKNLEAKKVDLNQREDEFKRKQLMGKNG